MFDQTKYRSDVLVPLTRSQQQTEELQKAIRDFQGAAGVKALGTLDLIKLFAIDPSGDAAALESHLKRLVLVYNKQRGVESAALLKRLLELMQSSLGAKITTPSFWSALASERVEVQKVRLDVFAAAAAVEYPLKVVSIEELAVKAAGTGLAGVPESDLTAAMAKHDVQVFPAIALPELVLPPPVKRVLAHAEFRTLADVVLLGTAEGADNITLIDSFGWGTPPKPIGPEQISQAAAASVRGRDSDALQDAQKALTALKGLGAAQLRDFILVSVAGQVRAMTSQRMPLLAARESLVDKGISPTDAARLVAFAGAAPALQTVGPADVLAALAAGSLGEARRLLAAVAEDPADPELTRAAAAVSAAAERKAALLREFETRRAAFNYSAAAAVLRDAILIDSDDENLAQTLALLPPPPPDPVVVRIDERSVAVSWRADPDSSVRYTVVRAVGRVPANHRDGDSVASGISQDSVKDTTALAGRRMHYAVFATRDGASYSLPATASIVVLPPPTQVAAAVGATEVSLSWTTPAESVGVSVTQIAPDGRRLSFPPSSAGRLSATGLTMGTRYTFALVASYVLSDGTLAESSASVIDATPRGEVRPANDLLVASGRGDNQTATWTPIPGYPVELWAFAASQVPVGGTWLDRAGLTAAGGLRLTGLAVDEGSRVGIQFPAPREIRLIVPVTVDGARGLVGASQVVGAAPPVQHPVAERFGDSVRLSWEWPVGDYAAEIRWIEAGTAKRRRVSQTGYRTDGGVSVAGAEHVADIRVATVFRVGDREWTSSPVDIAFQSAPPVISYSVSFRREGLRRNVIAVITAKSDLFRGRANLVVVMRAAKFMPIRPEDGQVIAECAVDIVDEPVVVGEFPIGRPPSPFWVRVFAKPSESVRIEDPPTTELRG